MIIIPGGTPRPATDYDGAWSSLSRRTKLTIALLAPVPVVLGVLALIVGSGWLTELAIVVAFAIWGSIGGYLGLVSDNRRIARRREKRQFRALADAELTDEQRRDAVYAVQRRAAAEEMKSRRLR